MYGIQALDRLHLYNSTTDYRDMKIRTTNDSLIIYKWIETGIGDVDYIFKKY